MSSRQPLFLLFFPIVYTPESREGTFSLFLLFFSPPSSSDGALSSMRSLPEPITPFFATRTVLFNSPARFPEEDKRKRKDRVLDQYLEGLFGVLAVL